MDWEGDIIRRMIRVGILGKGGFKDGGKGRGIEGMGSEEIEGMELGGGDVFLMW